MSSQNPIDYPTAPSMTLKEAAVESGVPEPTLRRMVRNGDLPGFRTGRRRIRITRVALAAMMDGRGKFEASPTKRIGDFSRSTVADGPDGDAESVWREAQIEEFLAAVTALGVKQADLSRALGYANDYGVEYARRTAPKMLVERIQSLLSGETSGCAVDGEVGR